jgi:hypothetical protein
VAEASVERRRPAVGRWCWGEIRSERERERARERESALLGEN